MTIIESTSLFQRLINAIKGDITKGDKEKALSKLEILEGEMDIFRKSWEEEIKEEEEKEIETIEEPEVVDAEVVENE